MMRRRSQDTQLGDLDATSRVVTLTSVLLEPKNQVHLGAKGKVNWC